MRGTLILAGFILSSIAFARIVSASDVSGIDPCRLVTKQEAQAALGAGISSETSPPARADRSPVRICSIRGTNGKGLTVFVGSKTKAGFDREKKGMTAVTGVGDDAYTNPMGIVALRKGEIVVTLSMTLNGMPDDTAPIEKMKTLACAVAGRI